MKREEYRDKLREWNRTPKYQEEVRTLESRMKIHRSEMVLDYGAGTGLMADYLRIATGAKVYAYDIDHTLYQGDPFWFRTELAWHMDKVYFMHSLAHIPNPVQILNALARKFLKPGAEVWIMTPNRLWLENRANQVPGYKPDPTVVKHYDFEELERMLRLAGAKEVEQHFPEYLHSDTSERLLVKAKFESP